MRSTSTRFALRSRSFSIFAAGSFVSQTGEWMTWVALNWAVLDATGSALYLAAINACRLIPAFVLSVPAGVLADRLDRRRTLVALYVGVTLSTLGVGYALSAQSAFVLLAAVATLRSVFMAAVVPVRNALIPDLVAREQLASAVAIDSAVRNVARIAGPAIAGGLLVIVATPTVFILAAVVVAAAILPLLVIRSGARQEIVSGDVRANVREVVVFVRETPSLQALLILAVAPLFFAFPYTAMMPLFANDLLRLGPVGLGVILSFAATGALVASAWLSLGGGRKATGRLLVISTVALGAFLVCFMFTTTLAAAMLVIFLVGFASSTYRTTSRVALQKAVPDRLRGRILSIALMDRGFMPLGALAISAVAELAGVFAAGIFMGLGCVAVTFIILAIRRDVWRL